MHRKQLIATRPALHGVDEISVNDWHKRETQFKKELLEDCPRLKKLHSSTLEFTLLNGDEKLELNAYLVESAQLTLPVGSRNDRHKDPFEQEVLSIKEELSQTSSAYALALSEATKPEDDQRTQEMRKSVRHRRKALLDEEHWNFGEMLFGDRSLPRFKPTAFTGTCKVVINAIYRKGVEATIIKPVKFSLIGNNVDLPCNKKGEVVLLRPHPHQGMETGLHLMQSLENRNALEIQFLVLEDWHTGLPVCLELCDICDAKDLPPP